MRFDISQRRVIYAKTDGRCHICHIKLSFVNYGLHGERGAWHIDHSRAQANGGTHHGNNLFAACIPCNLTKSAFTARTARKWNGTTKVPLSKSQRQQIREDNRDLGTLIGGAVGLVAGPVGIALGAFVGRQIGNSISPPTA